MILPGGGAQLLFLVMSGYTIVMICIIALAAVYAAGRMHQQRQTRAEREQAWQDGYAEASETLFSRAVRAVQRRPGERTTDIMNAVQEKPEGTVTDISAARSYGRHSLELRHEQTQRLPGPGSKAV